MILDGRAIAAQIWSEIEREAAALSPRLGGPPRLAVLRVGSDPASVSYARTIERAFAAHGLAASTTALAADSGQESVHQAVKYLTTEPGVHGLLLQLPLPAGLRAEPLIEAIPPALDLEGLRADHVGHLTLGRPTFIPSTPLAGLEILQRSEIELSGRLAVIVGRSQIIGRPMVSLLLQRDCTVVVCHSRTADLAGLTRQADLLIAATGRPGLIRGDMLKPGVVVVDFGTTMVDGKLTGDVDFPAAQAVAAAITPVPGGTGPVTTALLARNLVQAARLQSEDSAAGAGAASG